MLPDERLSAAAEEAAENERNDDDIVELARDRCAVERSAGRPSRADRGESDRLGGREVV